jgi:hypothetical protein
MVMVYKEFQKVYRDMVMVYKNQCGQQKRVKSFLFNLAKAVSVSGGVNNKNTAMFTRCSPDAHTRCSHTMLTRCSHTMLTRCSHTMLTHDAHTMLTHDAHPMLCAQCQVLGEKPGTSKARSMNDLEKVEKHIKDVIMPIRENLRKKRRNSGMGLTLVEGGSVNSCFFRAGLAKLAHNHSSRLPHPQPHPSSPPHWKRQVHPNTGTIDVTPPSGTTRTQRPLPPPTVAGNDSFSRGNKHERQELATQWWEELSALHGLVGWTFGFDQAKCRLGFTHYGTRRVTLSVHFVAAPHTTREIVQNILLHEIAHVLVGAGHGHDDVWVAKAKEIGCDGVRASNYGIGSIAAHKWTWRCEKGCTAVLRHQRNLRKAFVCRTCMTPMGYVLNQHDDRAARARA